MTSLNSLEEIYEQILQLQFGNTGTVVGELKMSDFAETLYVPDAIDDAAESFFSTDEPDGDLFVITGSAGDGKSAIFARAYTRATDVDRGWLDKSCINLDATASKWRDQPKIESLNEFLEGAIVDLEQGSGPRRGLAINLGIAINFFEKSPYNDDGTYADIWSAIKAARDPVNLDSAGMYTSTDGVTVVNLSYRPVFDTNPDPERFGTGLYRDIVDRFDYTNADHSPFHEVSDELPDEPEAAMYDPSTPYLIHNLAAFTREPVRENYAKYLSGRSLVQGQYLNPRHVLGNVAAALIPEALDRLRANAGVTATPAEAVACGIDPAAPLIWNGIYASTELESYAAKLDPCAAQSRVVDEQVLQFSGGQATTEEVETLTGVERMTPLQQSRTWTRAVHLQGTEEIETLTDTPVFRRFAATITYLDERKTGDKTLLETEAEAAFNKVVQALRAWSGHDADSDWLKLEDGLPSTQYQFFAEWDDPNPNPPASVVLTTKETRPGTFWFVFDNEVEIPLTFRLYQLMELTAQGYNPNALDLEGSEGVRLIRSQMSRFTEKDDEIEIRSGSGSRLYTVSKQGFGNGVSVTYVGDRNE